jgi:hypothetical protein
MKKNDLIGKRFGKLIVLSEITERNKNGHIKYVCKCDCGNVKEIFGTHLKQEKIVSCGCKNKINGVSGEMWYNIIKSGISVRNKRKNLDINITKEYLNDLYKKQDGKCGLSKLPITLPTTWKDRTYTASLDRINSDEGYVIGNVQWVHKHINVMKNTFPQEIFIFLCQQIAENNKTQSINIEQINNYKWGLNDKYKNK